MHFDVANYTKMWRLVLGDRPGIKQLAIQSGLLVGLGGWAASNAIYMTLDHLLFSGFAQQPVNSPLFIVGNPRSGTTFLHRLLSLDQEQFVSFHSWEIAMPSVVQQKTVQSFRGAIDRTLQSLSEHIAIPAVVQQLRVMHPLALDEPEEDEFVHVAPFSSPSLSIAFPYMEELPQLYMRFDDQPAAKRDRLMAYYRGCVQRRLYADGGGRRLLSKNPMFICRLRSLIEMFSDARFVYVVRDPQESILSTASLMKFLWQQIGICEERISRGIRQVVRDLVDDYQYALQVIPTLPKDQVCVVRYPDLIADPMKTVTRIYDRLGMEVSPSLATKLKASARVAEGYQSAHQYNASGLEIDIASVVKELGAVYAYWGLEIR